MVKAIEEERHQVGSILKPIIYHLFVQNGYTLYDMTDTKKFTLKLKSGPWSPRDSEKVVNKKVNLLEALLNSYNRPVIKISNDIGFDIIEKELVTYVPHLISPLAEYPSQLLGAVEMSLKEIFFAYSKFISEQCKIVAENREAQGHSILFMMSNPALTTVKKALTDSFSNMRFFGKTGTSNNGLDNWYIFFDGDYLGVVWAGLEGSRESKKLRLSGTWTAFRVFQYFMESRGKRFHELSCPGY